MTSPNDNPSPRRMPGPAKRGIEAIAAVAHVAAQSLSDNLLSYGTKWPKALVREIDDWAAKAGVSRSEAIRRLVELGLKAETHRY